jgi:hypothetical protein
MRTIPDRAIFTVVRQEGGWVVEHDGQHFGHSLDKEVTLAAANKQARLLQDTGRACRVCEGVRSVRRVLAGAAAAPVLP